jgi:hypothetical protein
MKRSKAAGLEALERLTPAQLADYLDTLASERITLSTMIWGPPGIGKSSIVQQVAAKHDIGFVDLRLSQLAPTDLRGLPVAEEGISRWYPPEFLPREGEGILFLDEINMAPPAMQGVAQQLILDRRVGSYEVPEGWLIWAAGNRKEDRAAVFDMPAPLANRFVHLEVEPDFASFKAYALAEGIHERLMAFLSYRPVLLHRLDAQAVSWPSPRSWMMADRLIKAELDIAPAVGAPAAAEFAAYCEVYDKLPDIKGILSGKKNPAFPKEPSVRYAVVIGLVTPAQGDAAKAVNALRWIADKATMEWAQLFASDLMPLMRRKGTMPAFAKQVMQDTRLKKYIAGFRDILTQ